MELIIDEVSVRVTGLAAAAALSACAAGGAPSVGTAIYVPATRLGGHGGVMFLPAAGRSSVAREEAVLRAVLAEIGTPGSVTPTLWHPPFAAIRGEMAEAENPITRTRTGRAAFVRARTGQWTYGGAPIDPATAARLLDAAVVIVERNHRLLPLRLEGDRRNGPKVPPAVLAAGQSLGERAGCTSITLSEVVRDGDLAFVDVGIVQGPLAGMGQRWALEQVGGAWKVLATQMLWVS